MATIATGRVLHRVHAATVAAKWYGRKDATWRWDDPDRKFGVLYLGKTLVGPFAETLLRRPTDRDVLWDQVARRRAASFSATRPIRLAKVHGPGLGWFRTTTAGVSADFDPVDNPGAYAVPQGRVRQCGVELGVASGLHFQAALGVICSGCASSIIGVARAAMPSICM
ncbi:hypothetical protein [Sphingobium sp. LB126]|uniref:hypothetical protein n=1 Tax=Sphingobium sp. LB126 TaxID=1983755 RepID=UPI001F5B340B|nr:hypothetical protein [Sphingobium sp. LB126]